MITGLIAHYLGPRLGIGNYLNRLLPPLVEVLTQRNVDFRILASPNAVENTPALQRLAQHVDVLPELDYSPTRRYWWLTTKFSHYCYTANLDSVIWLSNPVLLPWHPPSIAVIHDVNEWKMKDKYGNQIRTILRSLIYLDASIWFSQKIISVSQATETDLLHFRPQLNHKKKIQVIPNGSDSSLTDFEPTRIATSGHPFLLSVGRIDPASKYLPEAVNLVKALREKSGQPWELQLVGGINESTRQDGEAFLRSLSDLDWVHYQGHVSDRVLAQWYRQAAGVVFLSESEGFGCPIVEAASFNKWVVVNQSNQASLEVGEGTIIPISVDRPNEAAIVVQQKLMAGEKPRPNPLLPTWKLSAERYASSIETLKFGYTLRNSMCSRGPEA